MNDNSFEKFPGGNIETETEREVPPEENFTESFKNGVPPYAGEQFGVANKENEFYGESVDERESESGVGDETPRVIDNWLLQADKQARDISEKHSGFNNNASESNHEHADEQEPEFKDNEKVRKAVLIAGYGLDAVAREKGVEHVVQGIKSFDTSGSDNPLRDLFMHLGVETVEDFKEIRDEAVATRRVRDAFRAEYGMPKTQEKTKQGLMMAIADMKELIAEVEGVDPRYAELRRAAEAAGMGYFEYAVMNFERRGLMELFTFLMKQREQKESPEQVEDLEKSSSESEGAVL